jgi:hypothetical protein
MPFLVRRVEHPTAQARDADAAKSLALFGLDPFAGRIPARAKTQ